MSTGTLQCYRVTVALLPPLGNETLLPPDDQAFADEASAVVAAEDLLTASTSEKAVLSMVIGSAGRAVALSAGWVVARASPGGRARLRKPSRFPAPKPVPGRSP